MLLHRLSRLGIFVSVSCLLHITTPNAGAAHIPGMVQLGGWVYVDRNNDGHLAFSNESNPEFVIGDVAVSLFSKLGNVETFVSSTVSDNFGRYLFANMAPGSYILRETQPVEYVDGIDTLGRMQSLNGQAIPSGASAGVATDNAFTGIVMPANVGGDYYNFGERGLALGYASKTSLFSSAPPLNTASPEPVSIMLALVSACGSCLVRTRGRRN